MRVKHLIAAALFTAGSLFNLSFAAQINLKVTDTSGQIIEGAQVHFNKDFINTDTLSFDVPSSGVVRHTLPDQSAWLLSVTAPHKEAYISYIMVDGEKQIDINVQLPYYQYSGKIKELKIIHSDIGFSSRNAVPLIKTGEYTYEIDIKTDNEIKYQIAPLLERDGYIHGQIQDSFEYDKRGGYLSVLKPKNGIVSIKIDTELYENVDDKLSATITPDSVSEKAELMRYFDQAKKNWFQALADYVRLHGNRDGFAIDESQWKQKIDKYLRSDKAPTYKHIAAVGTAFLYDRDVKISNYALENVPADSPLWNLFDGYVTTTLLLSGVDMTDIDRMISEGSARVQKLQNFIDKFTRLSPYTDSKKKLLGTVIRVLISDKQFTLAEFYLESYKNHLSEDEYYVDTLNTIKRSKKTLVGKASPKFNFPSLSNQETIFQSESFKGKYVLIDFWATWCSPCIAEMSVLHSVYEQYKSKNFEILSVSIDESKSLVDSFRKGKWTMPWKNSLLNETQIDIAKEQFNINGIPSAVLIDPTGKVIAQDRQIRGENLHRLLESLLNKHSG
jgi:thiol-disulfide isomerase/thioredoxin